MVAVSDGNPGSVVGLVPSSQPLHAVDVVDCDNKLLTILHNDKVAANKLMLGGMGCKVWPWLLW